MKLFIKKLAEKLKHNQITELQAEESIAKETAKEFSTLEEKFQESNEITTELYHLPPEDAFWQIFLVNCWHKYFENQIVFAYSSLQVAYWACKISRFSYAIEKLEKCMNVFYENGIIKEQLQSLVLLGNAYRNTGKLDKAITCHQEAFDIACWLNNKYEQWGSLNNLGITYRRLGDKKKAAIHYEKALDIATSMGYQLEEQKTLSNLGNLYSDLGEMDKALLFNEKATTIIKNNGDEISFANQLGNLGTIYYRIGKLQKSLECHEQSLDIYRLNGDRLREAQTLSHIGVIYVDWGEVRKAIEHYNQALEITKDIDNDFERQKTLSHIGSAWYELGEIPQAIQYYQDALSLSQTMKYKLGEGSNWMGLGNSYRNMGKKEDAIKYYEQALHIFREIENKVEEGQCLGNLATAYDDLRVTDKAKDCYLKAIDIARQTQDRISESLWLCNIANICQDLTEFSKASEYYQQALSIPEKTGYMEGHRFILESYGKCYYEQKDYENAYHYFCQSLELLESLRASISFGLPGNFIEDKMGIYSYMVDCCLSLGKIEEAWALSEKARARFLSMQIAAEGCLPSDETPSILREKYQQNRKDLKFALLEQELFYKEKSEQYPSPELLKKLEQTAKETLEEIRRYDPEFSDIVLLEFPNIQEIQKEIPEGILLIEFFVTVSSIIVFGINKSGLEVLRIEGIGEKDIRKIYEEWSQNYKRSNFDSYYQIYEKEYSQLTKITQESYRIKNKNQENKEKYIQAKTNQEKYEKHFSDFFLEPIFNAEELKTYKGIIGKWSEKQKQEIKKGHLQNWKNGIDNTLKLLSKKLIALLQWKKFVQAKSIVFIPHKEFSLFPLHLFQIEDQYICDLKLISYAPSAKILLDGWKKRKHTDKSSPKFLGIIADPKKDLQFAYPEVISISEIFKQKEIASKVLYDSEAKLDQVLYAMKDASFIYFSCHAIFYGEFRDSGILLDEGKLSLVDLFFKCRLKNTQLVVLSACETGISENRRSSEYVSIATGFLYAGALCVLGTLWAVDDLPTYLLMNKFMENYIENHNAISALQNAQKWLREIKRSEVSLYIQEVKQKFNMENKSLLNMTLNLDEKIYKHPYYWAGFYVI